MLKFDFYAVEETADGYRIADIEDWCYLNGIYKTFEEAQAVAKQLEDKKNKEADL